MVQIGEDQKYRVTDGGATDNRGLVSLLYALRDVLQTLKERDLKQKLPPIYILVAEASVFGFDYDSHTGLDVAFSGAKVVLANGLIEKLFRDSEKLAESLKMFYLPMPAILRSRGGLGTHWLMPSSFSVSDPTTPEKKASVADISAELFFCTLNRLYSLTGEAESEHCNKVFKEDSDFENWKKWIVFPGDDAESPGQYAENWRALVDQ